MKRRLYLIAGSFVGLLCIWIGSRGFVLALISKLEVGPDTTVVDGPLRPDGTVDFEAALNARISVGITPANNAAVPLERAFGLADLPVELRSRYCHNLGITEPPAEGKYVVSERIFAQQQTGSPTPAGARYQALLDEMGQAQERPWTRTEFPRVAAWIDLNLEPLKLVEQASLRPKFYAPLVSSGGLIEAPYHLAQNLRTAARLLVTRAMLRIAEGDLEGAANDLLTCQRLAGLLGSNSTLIGNLVAMAVDAIATQGEQVWLAQALTVEQIQRLDGEVKKLANLTEVAVTFDRNERLTTLDAMQSLWRGTESLGELDRVVRVSRIDINVALRRCNAYYDSLVKVMRLDGVRNRAESLMKLHEEQKRLAKEAVSGPRLIANYLWDSRNAVSDSVSIVMVQLLTPAVTQAQTAEDRARMRRELLHVGVALARHHATRGAYPEKLEMLKPEFLKQIPLDAFIDLPLHYQVRPDGYLLYSVGPNRKDDGGQPRKGNLDDIVFEVTHEVKP